MSNKQRREMGLEDDTAEEATEPSDNPAEESAEAMSAPSAKSEDKKAGKRFATEMAKMKHHKHGKGKR